MPSWSSIIVITYIALVPMCIGNVAWFSIVGMLPGLGPINGVALLIPIAFALGLPPETALILLAAVYLGCEYGGRISSILLNIPGEASTVMTTLDGYPMARKGLAGVALSLSAWSSFIGAFIATCGMVLFAPLLAKWAIAFGPAEYFVLMVFAIVCLGGMAGDKPLKTFVAALIGLFLTLFYLFIRVLPMISIFEMRTLLPEATPKHPEGEGHP